MALLEAWKECRHVVVGVVHAMPLPGAPRFHGNWQEVIEAACADAATLVAGGVDGLILENFGDTPFFPRRVPALTVAHLTVLAVELKRQFRIPLGLNVLRNDGLSALAIASASGADFIRVNILCGARLTDQGIIEGIAHDLLRARRELAPHVRILADVDVKHSAPLAIRSLEDEVVDLVDRGGADAVIVSGSATGKPASVDHLRAVRQAAGNTPVFAGSGVTPDNLAEIMAFAHGSIIGTYFKRDGITTNAVELSRVQAIMSRLK